MGDTYVVDDFSGRIRSMRTPNQKNARKILAGQPVEILGLKNSVEVGQILETAKSQQMADNLAKTRLRKK